MGHADPDLYYAQRDEDRAAEEAHELDRALECEACDLAARLTDGRALTTYVKPCWAYGSTDVPLGLEFVAWVEQTRDDPAYDLADFIFRRTGQFHRLLNEFGRDYAAWEMTQGALR